MAEQIEELKQPETRDLIDRREFIQFLISLEKREPARSIVRGSIALAADWAREMPRVEAEPVVHAHWIFNEAIDAFEGWYVCSNCGSTERIAHGATKTCRHCYNCGARMDEVTEE